MTIFSAALCAFLAAGGNWQASWIQMSARTLENICFAVLGLGILAIVLLLTRRFQPRRQHPDGSTVCLVSSLVLLSQSVMFWVLSLPSEEDVTRPIMVFAWLGGMLMILALWLIRGPDDGGGGWDDDRPEPLMPDGIPWHEFDRLRGQWERDPVLR